MNIQNDECSCNQFLASDLGRLDHRTDPHGARLYAIVDVHGGGPRADMWMCSEHLGSIRAGIPSDINWKPLRSGRNELLYCALISPSRQLHVLEHPDYWDPDFTGPDL